jgi:hypothetical protein
MQTLKEDNVELMKRIRVLNGDKVRLRKDFRARSAAMQGLREQLGGAVAAYKELFEEDGEREDGPHAEELARRMSAIEALNSRVSAEGGELARVREELKEVERRLIEEQAAAAAQHSLLEEDAGLRKAIAEEERRKVEQGSAAILERQLAEERERLHAGVAKERAELVARYGEGATSEREQSLELALLDANAEVRMLILEAKQAAQAQAQTLREVRADHRRDVQEVRLEGLRMFRELVAGFEDEKAALEARILEYSKLLGMASRDLAFMTQRASGLERQLLVAAAYEAAP